MSQIHYFSFSETERIIINIAYTKFMVQRFTLFKTIQYFFEVSIEILQLLFFVTNKFCSNI